MTIAHDGNDTTNVRGCSSEATHDHAVKTRLWRCGSIRTFTCGVYGPVHVVALASRAQNETTLHACNVVPIFTPTGQEIRMDNSLVLLPV
jgi:hypothetical protein